MLMAECGITMCNFMGYLPELFHLDTNCQEKFLFVDVGLEQIQTMHYNYVNTIKNTKNLYYQECMSVVLPK